MIPQIVLEAKLYLYLVYGLNISSDYYHIYF